LFKVEPGEITVLVWSCAYFFFLMSGYYILRAVRDAWGAASGARNLPWLYLATAILMLVASIAFAAITTRLSRRRFIPYAYRFFIVNLLLFMVLFKLVPAESHLWLGRSYFVWVSVFNLFVVSVFWSFMADVFTNVQGKRLFAIIAVGGTLGQICGAIIAGQLAGRLGGTENLLVVSMVFLEAACWCVYRLNTVATSRDPDSQRAGTGGEAAIGGGPLDGLLHIVRSRYLAGIALFILCYTMTSTFLYATKIMIALQETTDQETRIAFFARIDLWTGVVTILAQIFLTSRLMTRFGVGPTLAVLPAVTLLGFALLGLGLARPEWLPTIALLTAFEAVRRASNYAVSRPAREVLFTVVARQDKYKTKNVIDTFVYRSGDQVGIWAHAGLLALGLSLPGICFAVIPFAAGWLLLSLVLGRKQRVLAGNA
jgi:AAA family ATP:ADP antiporter